MLLLLFNPLLGQAQSYEVFQAEQAFQNQEFNKVVSIAEQILKRDSLNLKAHRLLITSLLAQQKAEEALKAANNALHYFPGATSLRWIKAESLLQLGNVEDALTIYKQLLNEDTSFSKEIIRQRIGFIHQTQGGRFYQDGNYEAAENHLKEAKNYMPDSLASYSNLALVYMQQMRWDEALKIIDEGRTKFPNNISLQQIRAGLLVENGDSEDVISEYKLLYDKEPKNVDIALPYAQLLMQNGEMKKASDIYEQLLAENPGERKIYESLITFYDRRQRFEAKRQILQKMQAQFPKDVTLLNRIAKTYQRQRKWELERAMYDSVMTIEGPSKPILIAVAETFIKQDSLPAADHIYGQALKISPRDEELLRLRGDLQIKAQEWKSAEQTFATLAEIKDDGYAYAQQARAQQALGKHEAAFQNYKKALAQENDSVNPEVYLQLSKIYREKDRVDQAYNLGEKALREALKKVEELQQGLMKSLDSNKSIAEMKPAAEAGKALKDMNDLTIRSFDYVTTTFSQQKVMLLLNSLKQEYAQSGRLLFMISTYYQENGKEKEALGLAKKAVQFSPNLAEAHIVLGQHYQKSNQKKKAIVSYERARSAAPDDVEPYIQLIELYQQMGELNQLCERWLAQHRANPENKMLREYLIAALQKADRFEDAQKIINDGNPD